jgi:hypothetical protein
MTKTANDEAIDELGADYDAQPGNLSARNCAVLRSLRIAPDFRTADVALLLGGETTAATLADVGKAFHIGLAQAKAWAAMWPAELSTRPYDLLAILTWRLMEDERGAERQYRGGY